MNIKTVCVLVLLFLPALAYSAIAQQRSYMVFFDYGSSNITGEASRIIKDAADLVTSQPSSKVEVIGHSDTAENAAISRERARNVAAKLVTLGVSSDHIYVTGVGDSKPFVPTAENVSEPQNRCVQFKYLGKKPMRMTRFAV
jgi:outer membrane protein OmpA-like peptidoglycan-associated protein